MCISHWRIRWGAATVVLKGVGCGGVALLVGDVVVVVAVVVTLVVVVVVVTLVVVVVVVVVLSWKLLSSL